MANEVGNTWIFAIWKCLPNELLVRAAQYGFIGAINKSIFLVSSKSKNGWIFIYQNQVQDVLQMNILHQVIFKKYFFLKKHAPYTLYLQALKNK